MASPKVGRRQEAVGLDKVRIMGQDFPLGSNGLVVPPQQVSARVIERYEGYIAQYLGDGLLVYFGYPVAHEDDAARAIRAGVNLPGLTSGAYSNASSACPKSSFS